MIILSPLVLSRSSYLFHQWNPELVVVIRLCVNQSAVSCWQVIIYHNINPFAKLPKSRNLSNYIKSKSIKSTYLNLTPNFKFQCHYAKPCEKHYINSLGDKYVITWSEIFQHSFLRSLDHRWGQLEQTISCAKSDWQWLLEANSLQVRPNVVFKNNSVISIKQFYLIIQYKLLLKITPWLL